MTRKVTRTIPQGVDESVRYRLNFARLVADHGVVADAATTLYNNKLGIYQNDKLSGDEVIDGDVVSSKTVSDLENRTLYTLSVAATFADGQTLSGAVPIMGEV